MSRWTRAQLPIIQQLLMPVVQPGTYQQLLANKEPQDLPYNRGAKANKINKSLRDMFRYLKWRQFNLRMMVKKGWKGMDLPENFATCMSRMRDGEGGIIHFEGQINHPIPVRNEQCLASEYYKCAGQLIACWVWWNWIVTVHYRIFGVFSSEWVPSISLKERQPWPASVARFSTVLTKF